MRSRLEGVSEEIAFFCPDAIAEGMYIELCKLRVEANAQRRTVIVSGDDFNAVVGTQLPADPPHLIGEHGFW